MILRSFYFLFFIFKKASLDFIEILKRNDKFECRRYKVFDLVEVIIIHQGR